MANQEQLEILRQGVKIWREWRRKNFGERFDLSSADLSNAHLHKANLVHADLRFANLRFADLRQASLWGAHLCHADLSHANLQGADLHGADLSSAILSNAHLREANLSFATLNGANLHRASLHHADLSNTDLSNTDLSNTDLRVTDLREANLREANLREADLWLTVFVGVDLSTVKGLETVKHTGPSIIEINTVYLSQGKIPEVFLKGAGIPDSFIEYMRSLVGSPIDYYSCFISYSSKDEAFAKRLYTDLQNNHVRCWFAPEDLKIGDKIRTGIDEAIRIHDKLLLVLSGNSVDSAWVEKEVETAFDKEVKTRKLVLFPVRLDNAVMETDQAWAADIRRMRNIGDFTRWKNHDDYERAFNSLLCDLKSEAMA
jgi:TIR domain/Pentapeptide repeats (8 copies)